MASNKFPVKRLILHGEEALEQSKDKGKNKITILGETICFGKYSKMIDLYYKFNESEKELSEGAVYNLIRIENQKPSKNGQEKMKKGAFVLPNADPYIKYSIARNWKGDKEKRDEFIKDLIEASDEGYLKTSVALHSLYRRYFKGNQKGDENVE